MKTRNLTLVIILLLVFSKLTMAQVPDPMALVDSPKLKTDLVGSYPQVVQEYNWVAEFWLIYQTTYITYTSFGEPSEEKMIGTNGDSRFLYTYNSDHNQTEVLEQHREGGEEWVNYTRELIEYVDGRWTSKLTNEQWNGSGWDMIYGNQYTYTYDGDLITGFVIQIWDKESGQWINSTRTTQSYSSEDGMVSEAVSETWEDGAWVNFSKVKYVWLDEQIGEMYMSGWLDNAWVESTKMTFDYGDFSSLTFTVYIGPGDGTWTPSQRIIDQNDSHENLILSTMEFYTTDWEMLSGMQFLLTYNGNDVTERITKMYSPFEPGISSTVSTSTWNNVLKEVFSEFASLSSIPLLLGGESISHYPNPASDQVDLNIHNLKNTQLSVSVMSLSGQAGLTELINVPTDEYHHALNVRSLPAGTYIILTNDKSGRLVSSSKLIIQK